MNWHDTYLSNDVNFIFNLFEDAFGNILNKHAPVIKTFIRNSNVIKEQRLMTDECKQLSAGKKVPGRVQDQQL